VIDMSYKTADGSIVNVVGYDAGRAFHNAYFEMLGEQGYPGLALFLLIHLGGIFRMEMIRRTYRKNEGEHAWVSPLAAALQHGHLVYLLGCSFVGIAFQPFIYFMIAVEIGFDRYVQTHVKKRVWNPFRRPRTTSRSERPKPGRSGLSRSRRRLKRSCRPKRCTVGPPSRIADALHHVGAPFPANDE
jgi:hypothetical protein